MNNELNSITIGEVISSAVVGPYGPLAIAVIGIVAVFSIYMSHTTEFSANLDYAKMHRHSSKENR